MSKQANDFSRYEMSGKSLGFMLSRKVLAGITAVLISMSLVFTPNVFAHNIDLETAWEHARVYARRVRQESKGRYQHYMTQCVKAFPNHNRIVRCAIDYQSAEDRTKGVFTCTESIEIYFPPHGGRPEKYQYHARHTSGNKCGRGWGTHLPTS